MELSRTQFDEIYTNNFNNLYKVALRITGTPHDAEDALQDAYLNAYKSIDGFEKKSAISTWLYRITVNSSLSYIKHRKTFPVARMAMENGVTEQEFFECLKSFKSVEEEVLYNDMRETCLQMFLECLPRKQRLTFVLKVLMNLPVCEVAQILEISESAVKTNTYRARETMKNAMDGKCSFIDPSFPCQCKLWVNYAIQNNRRDLIPNMKTNHRPVQALNNRVLAEINFLKKVSVLYDSSYEESSAENFMNRMKNMISSGDLKIFK